MNKEIYSIIEDMKRQKPKETARPDILLNYQSVQMAQLLVLLAEESERQGKKIEEYTKRTVIFTKVLLWFTAALIFIGVLQIIMMIVKP